MNSEAIHSKILYRNIDSQIIHHCDDFKEKY